jgi:tRNA (guanine37-N1)-methyltransferase
MFFAETILREALPGVPDITTKFEQVGHIAHMNIQAHLLQYKYLIGQVILKVRFHIRLWSPFARSNAIWIPEKCLHGY